VSTSKPISYLSNWLTGEIATPQFSAADMCGLTGISGQSLQNWANRGLVRPKASKKGKGGIRLYNKVELFIVKVARGLIPIGFEASSAIHIAGKALIALTDEVVENSLTDEQILQAVAFIAADPLGREHGAIILRDGKTLTDVDAKLLKAANEILNVSVGKHLWSLYKSHSTLQIEVEKNNPTAARLPPKTKKRPARKKAK
jgi:hypothetical protein